MIENQHPPGTLVALWSERSDYANSEHHPARRRELLLMGAPASARAALERRARPLAAGSRRSGA